MKKVCLLSIIAIFALVGSFAKGIEYKQTRLDIAQQWAKVYAGGLGIGIGSHMLGLPTVARAGFRIGSPITSLPIATYYAKIIISDPQFKTGVKNILTPADLIIFRGKAYTSMVGKATARAKFLVGLTKPIAEAAIPAIIGFGAIPYTVEKCNDSIIPWAVEKMSETA